MLPDKQITKHVYEINKKKLERLAKRNGLSKREREAWADLSTCPVCTQDKPFQEWSAREIENALKDEGDNESK